MVALLPDLAMPKRTISKQRSTSIVFDMGVPVSVGSVKLSDKGIPEFRGADGRILSPIGSWISTEYARPKGAKVLNRTPTRAGVEPTLDFTQALLQYNSVVALDTNSKEINGKRFSVTAMVQLRRMEGAVGEASLLRAFCFVQDVDGCHPDLVALAYLVKDASIGNPSSRHALILDSNLRLLNDISKGLEPILDDFFLPRDIELIYASDAAVDTLANVLLRTADKWAKLIMSRVSSLPGGESISVAHTSYFANIKLTHGQA